VISPTLSVGRKGAVFAIVLAWRDLVGITPTVQNWMIKLVILISEEWQPFYHFWEKNKFFHTLGIENKSSCC
jgi:hypothetical protein